MISDTVRRAQAGDQEAFADLYEHYRVGVRNICQRWTMSLDLAEDLTQDVFIQVMLKLHTFRGEAQFSTWLYRIARNVTLMHFRKHHVVVLSLEENENEEGRPLPFDLARRDPELDSTIDRIAVWRAIDTLAPRQKTNIILKDIHGMDHCEVARTMGVTVGNSKSQVHKAREKVRRALCPKRIRRPRLYAH